MGITAILREDNSLKPSYQFVGGQGPRMDGLNCGRDTGEKLYQDFRTSIRSSSMGLNVLTWRGPPVGVPNTN